jgi:NitT/TauT family transport system permease protein
MSRLKIREELSKRARWLSAVAGFLAFLGIWTLLSFPPTSMGTPIPEDQAFPLVKPSILPSPIIAILSIPDLIQDGLFYHAILSILRVTAGTVLAAVFAVPLGLFMGTFPRIRSLIAPVAEPMRYLPMAALSLIVVCWFGGANPGKVMFLFIGTVVYLLPLVVATVDRVDQVYLNTGFTLGASRRQTIWHVILPIALPDIAESIRVVNGIGWTYIIIAEMLTSDGGLGHVCYVASRRGYIDRLYVVVTFILIIGLASDKLIAWINRVLFSWKEDWS